MTSYKMELKNHHSSASTLVMIKHVDSFNPVSISLADLIDTWGCKGQFIKKMIQPGNFGSPQSCKTENNLPNVAPSSSHGTGSLSPNLWPQRRMIILIQLPIKLKGLASLILLSFSKWLLLAWSCRVLHAPWCYKHIWRDRSKWFCSG